MRGAPILTHTEDESPAQRLIRVSKAFDLHQYARGEREDSPKRMFGIEIGALRRRHRMSLDSLAERSNIEVDTLLAIELGITPLREVTDNLRAIADGLGESYQSVSKLLFNLILDQ